MVSLATMPGLLVAVAAGGAAGFALWAAAMAGADGAGPVAVAAAAVAGASAGLVVASLFELLLASTRMTERTESFAVRFPVASSSVMVLARIEVALCHSWASPLYSACPVCWL